MPEEATNGAAHGQNIRPLNEDEQRALAFHHRREYRDALASKKEADAGFKNTCKRIIAEGTSIADVREMIKLDGQGGEAALRAEIERMMKVARWMGASIGEQFDLEDAINDRRPLDERAYAAGKVAGMNGDTCSAPYDGHAGQEWIRGWHDGQASLMSALELTKAGAAQVEADSKAAREASEVARDIKAAGEGKKRRGRKAKGFTEALTEQNAAVEEQIKTQSEEAAAAFTG